MDLTGWCIASGLVGVVPHAAVKGVRHKRQDIAEAVTIFLGMASLPMGLTCIAAALSGDPAMLPPNWRVYVAVAGTITILLTVGKVTKAFVNDLQSAPRPAHPVQAEGEPERSTARLGS
jgi:hypothetical protein